ncbi:hypothetical protein PY092_12605 [Muricauda sp. 334s03]|uniref:Carboxypeptidase regulatory-like domain-containing protein n=1 Tax=Flagellimonas yonaguniensis TaxID=3031325 RepID=A0ABT5Y0R7_9FLAO|nr:hypothetical protein [[Muricauda] yonaguniensis]MDF0716995.1 hypothetical protein [[Muricauda] yonaguniensis]
MEKIFWELYNADYESDVEKFIKNHQIFQDNENWKPYGGNKGNFGTFESQQNHPVPALIEKITNSIDATLIKECKLIGLDPKSSEAPKSMNEAVELFYGVKNGEIGELTNTERRELAENIQVIATGDKQQPSITIFDMGEGQLPNEFENTFLSLHQNNKASIQFVQGKYNMGSTGAVVFCGEKKYQLIASKKNKHLNNGIESEIGFTLVRRHPLSLNSDNGNFKATWYEYFCPIGKIPSFKSKNLDLGLYNKEFEYGSIVKLYSYQLPRGSRSDFTLDLWRDLNQYMYHLPLPISVYEKRDYAGKTPSKPVLGNRTRIIIDSRDKVEKIIEFSIPKESGLGDISIQVIIFKNEVPHNDFIKNKSIIFTQNGQVHGSEGQSFVSQSLGFSLIKQHTLIHVDCTNIPTEIRQDLFMSNRTHLKQGPKTEKLLDEIISLLKGNKELKKLNNERKNSLLRDSTSDKDLLENFLSKLPVDKDVLNLLKKNGSLNFLKSKGTQFNGKNANKDKNGKKLNRFPGVFNVNLKENKEGKLYRTIPLNSNGIVTIETDVEDDYLFRPIEKGEFQIEVLQKQSQTDIPVNPHPNPNPNVTSDVLTVNRVGPSDGTIKLLIKPNEKAKVGDLIEVRAKLTSPGKDFSCVFDVKVDEKISKPKENDRKPTESFPNLPIPKKAFKEPINENDTAWDNPNLKWTGEDIVKVMPETNEDGELLVEAIIINMDSYSLLNFLSKNQIKTEKEIKYIKDKYFLSIYLHSLFLFSIMQKMRKDDEHLKPIDIEEFISKMIKPYASFLLYENYHIEKFAFAE